MGTYILGIDIGTTSICALALEAGTGVVLASQTVPNAAAIVSSQSFARMQDPQTILAAATNLRDGIIARFGLPAAVGVTGQMHGILYLDGNGAPVSPLYTWQDLRAAEQTPAGETYLEQINRVTGYSVSAGYGLATHVYNLQNGLVPASAAKLCTIHDCLAMKLAGLSAPVMHVSDAASLGLFDLANGRFDAEATRKLGIDPSILPAVAARTEPIGLFAGKVPVCPAIGDNQASFFGSVGMGEGKVLVNVGTGSQVSVIGSLGKTAAGIECRPFLDGKFLLVGSSLCGGRAYAVLEKFFREVANLCGADIRSAYPMMDALMATYAGTAEPLSVSTLFDGTRENPALRGRIDGISVSNLTPAALMEGFMRGISEELCSLYRGMAPHLRETPEEMVGSGNGLRVNPVLCRMMEETFGLPLRLSESREEAALGAAGYAARER